MKHAPVARANDKNVIFFGPTHLTSVDPNIDARKKTPRAAEICTETSNDLLWRIKAKNGIRKVMRMYPMKIAKKAKIVL